LRVLSVPVTIPEKLDQIKVHRQYFRIAGRTTAQICHLPHYQYYLYEEPPVKGTDRQLGTFPLHLKPA